MKSEIEIVAYNPGWPQRYVELRDSLQQMFSSLQVEVHHIGSTSVPGLASKDRIDIQITIPEGSPTYINKLNASLKKKGHSAVVPFEDHRPPGDSSTPENWQKFFIRGETFPYSCNIHVRVKGRRNQRYPILFRDYLRSHPKAAMAYSSLKQKLAKYHGADGNAYCEIKDPVCDVIMVHAEEWAERTHWHL